MSILEEIQDLRDRGYTDKQIAQITGYEMEGINEIK